MRTYHDSLGEDYVRIAKRKFVFGEPLAQWSYDSDRVGLDFFKWLRTYLMESIDHNSLRNPDLAFKCEVWLIRLSDTSVANFAEQIGQEWVNPNGKLVRRIRNMIFKGGGYELSPDQMSVINENAQKFRHEKALYSVVPFPANVVEKSEEWGNERSCWFSNYNLGRLRFIQGGGLVLQVLRDNQPLGRLWLYMTQRAACGIVFNHYLGGLIPFENFIEQMCGHAGLFASKLDITQDDHLPQHGRSSSLWIPDVGARNVGMYLNPPYEAYMIGDRRALHAYINVFRSASGNYHIRLQRKSVQKWATARGIKGKEFKFMLDGMPSEDKLKLDVEFNTVRYCKNCHQAHLRSSKLCATCEEEEIAKQQRIDDKAKTARQKLKEWATPVTFDGSNQGVVLGYQTINAQDFDFPHWAAPVTSSMVQRRGLTYENLTSVAHAGDVLEQALRRTRTIVAHYVNQQIQTVLCVAAELRSFYMARHNFNEVLRACTGNSPNDPDYVIFTGEAARACEFRSGEFGLVGDNVGTTGLVQARISGNSFGYNLSASRLYIYHQRQEQHNDYPNPF